MFQQHLIEFHAFTLSRMFEEQISKQECFVALNEIYPFCLQLFLIVCKLFAIVFLFAFFRIEKQ
jgi:hypothetical protein